MGIYLCVVFVYVYIFICVCLFVCIYLFVCVYMYVCGIERSILGDFFDCIELYF